MMGSRFRITRCSAHFVDVHDDQTMIMTVETSASSVDRIVAAAGSGSTNLEHIDTRDGDKDSEQSMDSHSGRDS